MLDEERGDDASVAGAMKEAGEVVRERAKSGRDPGEEVDEAVVRGAHAVQRERIEAGEGGKDVDDGCLGGCADYEAVAEGD